MGPRFEPGLAGFQSARSRLSFPLTVLLLDPQLNGSCLGFTYPADHASVLLGMDLYLQSIIQPPTWSPQGQLQHWTQSSSRTLRLHLSGSQLDRPLSLMAPPVPASLLQPRMTTVTYIHFSCFSIHHSVPQFFHP